MSIAAPGEEVRMKYPFHMIEMIKEQPSALHATLEICKTQASDLTSSWGGRSKFILTGCGTSFHAALGGSYMLYALFQRTDAEAIQSFELTHYYSALNPRTAVTAFSHTGNTKTTIDSVKRARNSGALTLAITGTKESNITQHANESLVVGNGREKSRAHTKSYTSALFASMYLSAHFMHSQVSHGIAGLLLEQLNDVPQSVFTAIDQEEKHIAEIATSYAQKPKRYFFLGSGPNIATALEASLKMKETSYSVAEGMELEQFLHGPWVSLDGADSVVFLLAPRGPSQGRNTEILRVCKDLGVSTVAITDDKHVVDLASHAIFMPEVSEELSPLVYVVPLQIYAYYTALAKRINPDLIHYDDPKYWASRQITFPPGTH